MKRRSTRLRYLVIAVSALGWAISSSLATTPGAQLADESVSEADESASGIVIYLEDGPLVSDTSVRNGATYLPVLELVGRLALAFTEDETSETLTIRGPEGALEVINNSNAVRIGSRLVRMNSPVVREAEQWWVPVEFLTLPLADISGVRFRYEAGSPRIFAGSVTPALLDMNAAPNQSGTRLTIRTGTRINVRVQQDRDNNRVILSVDHSPFDPTRESLEYRDGTVRSVRFDDSNGNSRIVVETSEQLANVRLVPADDNRTFYVDFVPENTPGQVVAAPPSAPPDNLISPGPLRVIVIDAGHGGLDSGSSASGTLEKDLTLALARRFRSSLQARFDATVILTRDSDREMSHEERASIANNSKADLLISIHVGYSFDATESSSSLFVMHPLPDSSDAQPPSDDAFFQSWYRAYALNSAESLRLAEVLHQSLDLEFRRWQFPVRHAPVGLLASTAIPAVVVELGNANNEADLATLNNDDFQEEFVESVLDAIEAYGGGV
jgi:N-acetylmuramoyl-L-alanine amidase